MMRIDAKGLHYRELNERIREAVRNGEKELNLISVNGHRYIGDGIQGDIKLIIEGVPGNDLGAFMDGPTIIVKANAQDGIGNTMNDGKIVVDGHAGDVLGYGMRGGKIFIRKDVGYRVGIHMKAFKDKVPIIVVGGRAQDFLGEYMAGGILIVLGISQNSQNRIPIVGNFTGTGMHGGTMFIRGKIDSYQVGKEVGLAKLDAEDDKFLKMILSEYCNDFNLALNDILKTPFIKLFPQSKRPYGKLYAY